MAAPLGFKTFVTGDVLTAADTNGYLMQGVWTFASAAARDAAVTSPQEGNMCYLKDTDAVQYYSGSAWTAVGGSASAVACFAYKQATQSIPNATYTSVNWDAEYFDTSAIHSTSVNNDRFVVPAGKAGYYYLSAQIGWAGNATGIRQTTLYKNGSTQYSTPRIDPAVNATYNVTVSGIVNCAVADYLSVSVYQTSGGALNTEGNALGNPYSFLSIMYLGA
jgi:hypothetical protein